MDIDRFGDEIRKTNLLSILKSKNYILKKMFNRPIYLNEFVDTFLSDTNVRNYPDDEIKKLIRKVDGEIVRLNKENKDFLKQINTIDPLKSELINMSNEVKKLEKDKNLKEAKQKLKDIIKFFDDNRIIVKDKNKNVKRLKWITPDEYNKILNLEMSKDIVKINKAIKDYGEIMKSKIEKKEVVQAKKIKKTEMQDIKDKIKKLSNDEELVGKMKKEFKERVARMIGPGATTKRIHLEAMLKTLEEAKKKVSEVKKKFPSSDELLNEFVNNIVKNYSDPDRIKVVAELDEFVRSMGGIVEDIHPIRTYNIIRDIRRRYGEEIQPLMPPVSQKPLMLDPPTTPEEIKASEEIDRAIQLSETNKEIDKVVKKYVEKIETGDYDYRLLYRIIGLLAHEYSNYDYNLNAEYLSNLIRAKLDYDEMVGKIDARFRDGTLDALNYVNRYYNRHNIPNYNEIDERFRPREGDTFYKSYGRKLIGKIVQLPGTPSISKRLGLTNKFIDDIETFAPTLAAFILGTATTYGALKFMDYFFNKNDKLTGEDIIKNNQVKPFKPYEDKSVALTIYKPKDKKQINELVQQTPPLLDKFGVPQGSIKPYEDKSLSLTIYKKPQDKQRVEDKSQDKQRVEDKSQDKQRVEDKSVALTIYKPKDKKQINELVQQTPPNLGEFGPPQGSIKTYEDKSPPLTIYKKPQDKQKVEDKSQDKQRVEDKSVALTVYNPKDKKQINELVRQTPPNLGEFGPPQGNIMTRRGDIEYLKPFITKEYALNKNREDYLRQRNIRQKIKSKQ